MYYDNNYNIDRAKGEHLTLENRLVIAHLYNNQDSRIMEV